MSASAQPGHVENIGNAIGASGPIILLIILGVIIAWTLKLCFCLWLFRIAGKRAAQRSNLSPALSAEAMATVAAGIAFDIFMHVGLWAVGAHVLGGLYSLAPLLLTVYIFNRTFRERPSAWDVFLLTLAGGATGVVGFVWGVARGSSRRISFV